MSYETRTLKIAVCVKGEPIFHEGVTTIEITDEASGEFLTITQCNDEVDPGSIKIDSDEWPHIRAAIDKMVKECRTYE